MSYDEIILSSVAAEIAAMQAERDYCDLPDNHPVHRYPMMERRCEDVGRIQFKSAGAVRKR